MKTLYTIGCTAALLLTSLLGQAATYYQNAPGSSASLQALVNRAVAGDIIILRTGSHYVTEPVRLPIGKNGIIIRGETGAVVRKTPHTYNAAAFEISGNSNTLDLLEIDGGNLPEAGILIYGQRNTISNSRIHNCGNATAVGGGIVLHNTGTPVCAYNTVIGCSVYYNYMVGISQNGHSDGTIRDNQIYENGAEGLTVDIRSHNNYIYHNWIHLNNTADRGVGGVGIDFANGNRLDNNTIDFTRFRSGITFQNNIGGCDGTIVSNNHINNNEGYGILERWTLYRNSNTSFQNNERLNNRLGPQTIVYPASARSASTVASQPQLSANLTQLSIYPNPTQGNLTLELAGEAAGATTLTIQDLQGRQVYQRDVRGLSSLQIPSSQLPARGTYWVRVKTPATILTHKLVVAE